mmetsp:Transcript_93692/g.268130  ORF Transcript_93692/g.268130 Transcript_93692/m.268130 type:complete len:187 (-) Transcript_93692:96-656(-)
MGADDVGRYLTFRLQLAHSGKVVSAENVVGPIEAAPPSIRNLRIEGECVRGGALVATYTYIGGREGATECWWLRIRDGTRQTLSKPKPISFSGTTTAGDPRRHILSDADVGCTLKVKLRPVRSDFAQGEVATSKASGVVLEVSGPPLPTPPSLGTSPTTPAPPPSTTRALIRKPVTKEIGGFEVAL